MVQQTKRKPRKFDTRAKTMASTVAIAALIAGWNLVAHLDSANAQAKAAAPDSGTVAAQLATLAPPPLGVYLPTVTPVFRSGAITATEFQLPPLDIKPIATLAPFSGVLAQDNLLLASAIRPQQILALPTMPALVALPELTLPSLPSLPPPPPSSSGGSGNGSSGGGNSNGGGGGGQTSGGS